MLALVVVLKQPCQACQPNKIVDFTPKHNSQHMRLRRIVPYDFVTYGFVTSFVDSLAALQDLGGTLANNKSNTLGNWFTGLPLHLNSDM